jgi:predicted dehydrogenase
MESDRRDFLKVAAAGAAPLFVPRSAWGANSRPNYALIGAGGRGRYLNRIFQQDGPKCVAIAEVYEPNTQEALQGAPGAKPYVDYRELLQKEKDVDFVVLAGPDHHHCPMMLAALEAKKDVYAEKPLSKTLEESATMVAAVRKSKQVVQIGMQRRSAPAVMAAKKLVDDGVLGRITLVKPQWHWNIARPLDNTPLPGKIDWDRFLGNAPKRPIEPMRFRYWRYFWDYAGGNMTDQGTHLMDVVLWFTNSAPPKSAVCWGYVAKMEGAEHPDVFSAVFEMDKYMATWTLDYSNSFQNGWSITFMGDKGTMILDEWGYRVWDEPWKPEKPPIHQEQAPVPIENHVQNFLDCIVSRKDPNCTVEIAQRAVAGPHLANLAFRKARQVRLAPDLVKLS